MKELERQLNSFFDPGYEEREEQARRERNRKARSRRLAYKLAAELGVRIEVERNSEGVGYWLVGTGWPDENFCVDICEAADKLEQLKQERGIK